MQYYFKIVVSAVVIQLIKQIFTANFPQACNPFVGDSYSSKQLENVSFVSWCMQTDQAIFD